MDQTYQFPMAKRCLSAAITFTFLVAISFTQAQVKPDDIEGLRLSLKADVGVITEDNSGHGGTANNVKSWAGQSGKGTDQHDPDNKSKAFFEIREEEVRVGTMAVAMNGTVLLFKDDQEKRIILVKRSEDGGKTWGYEIVVGKMVKVDGDMSDDGRYRGPSVGWADLGNVIVDENTGDIMVFASSLKPAQILYRSRDHGKTWKTEDIVIKPDKNGWLSATMCSCDPGVTLRYGKKKGRLLMPTRVFVGYLNKGRNRKYFNQLYSNALYSDDGGRIWIPSAPFPLSGTGEAGLAELSDGRIYYNSRTHCRPGNRRIAFSYDGGETWRDEHEDDELRDGPPDVYGCKAGLVRLPYNDRDVLVFSSPGRRDKREDITVWVSFNGGQTWPAKRLVRKGPGNYTWLAAGRNGTPSEGMIYLLAGKDWLARFNLAWIMQGNINASAPTPPANVLTRPVAGSRELRKSSI
jgi:sialidase-1